MNLVSDIHYRIRSSALHAHTLDHDNADAIYGNCCVPQVRILEEVLRWESLDDAGFFILDTGLEIFTFQELLVL